jgi:urease gamma subunit
MTSDLGFIDPTAGGNRARIALAPRPMDLAGKVVGLIDNTKEQADVILATVAEALRDRYGVAKVIVRRKEHFSRPATEALLNEMAKEVQVAAAALGG